MSCVIGILPHERETKQPLEADLDLELPLRTAGQSGDLGASVDYAAVAARVREYVCARRARLLEELGYELCDLLLREFRVSRVTVTLRKPLAVPGAAYAAVQMSWPECQKSSGA